LQWDYAYPLHYNSLDAILKVEVSLVSLVENDPVLSKYQPTDMKFIPPPAALPSEADPEFSSITDPSE